MLFSTQCQRLAVKEFGKGVRLSLLHEYAPAVRLVQARWGGGVCSLHTLLFAEAWTF